MKRLLLLLVILSQLAFAPVGHTEQVDDYAPITQALLDLMFNKSPKANTQKLLKQVDTHWDKRAIPMIMDFLYLTDDAGSTIGLIDLLKKHTGEDFGYHYRKWYRWIWNQPRKVHPDYGDYKGLVYKLIDERFETYFSSERDMLIRLDEVMWGGVVQDGIPPLRKPKMLSADKAYYLKDDHVVFGIEVNGDARAYPKRILAWHEMFTDTVGGIPVTGVYCTLCGSVILYHSTHNNVHHKLGTSGFLYRSNKLMYDQQTQSLWSTISGKPVIGPLVGKGIKLTRGSVVTTSWGEWKRRHPDTTVLSLKTGHRRDYSEGAAYREYFATDQLMFDIPKDDKRLLNKAQVLALRTDDDSAKPIALSADFLKKNPIYHGRLGKKNFVVITDSSGANRAYYSKKQRFSSFNGDEQLKDKQGRKWTLSESHLENTQGVRLERMPAHRAFWFGWHSVYPETVLVK